MVKAVENPRPEAVHAEKHTFLTELVQLRIPIEQAGGDELVKDSQHKWRQDCK